MTSKEEILQQHLDFKRTSVKSIDKLKDIERYLKLFINYSSKPLNQFTESELTGFINSLHDKFKISSINNIKVYIKVFIKWFYVDYSSRFRSLDRICKNQQAPSSIDSDQMLKDSDVEKLISGENDLEWKVYWMVYFYGGFRPSEAIRLKWENIFFDGNETTIKGILSKTKKKFLKVLPQDVTHYLKEWRKFNSSEWVFPSPINKNLPLGRKAPYFRLTKLSKKVLGKQIYPYILRHSFATIRYNSKLKDDIVANQMGHSKSMKEKYTHLDDSELKANARLLWAKEKPLSPKERDELKQLKQDFQELKASIPIIIYEALLNRDEQLPEIKELVEAIHKDVKQGKINKRPIGTR